jgi:RNA polymerase sigma-70 factor (ECF subfamily)
LTLVSILPFRGRAGQRAADLERLHAEIESCTPSLRRYAWTLLRNGQDVDDLVHDTLVRGLDRLHMHDSATPVRPWLFTIMHNLFVSDLRRARARGERIPLETLVEEETGISAATQEHTLHWQELLRGLDTLPQEQRAVLLLVSVEDLSYAETAQVLGIPIGTVMSRLSRGRERLRETMATERRAASPAGQAVVRRVK